MPRLRAPLYVFGYRIRANAWVRDLKIAFSTLVGGTYGDHRLLRYLNNRPDLAPALDECARQMPQAIVSDQSLTAVTHQDWRHILSRELSGTGLELGALHRPMPTHSGMAVRYVDYEERQSLCARYQHVAASIVATDIVDDAQTLSTIGDSHYDFLISSHLIEHMRDPIGALVSWLRVIKPGGAIYLIAPDKRATFDRSRVRTTLEHLLVDYLQPSAERDFDHFVEFATLVHHVSGLAAVDEARRLVREGASIHLHVFVPADIVAIVRWIDANVTKVSIEQGPVMSPEEDEFHLILRKATGH